MPPVAAVLDRPTSTDAATRAAEASVLRVLVVDDERGVDALRPVLDANAVTVVGSRLHDVEGLLVRQAMAKHDGNVSRAARTLGLSRSALYRRLERHKID